MKKTVLENALKQKKLIGIRTISLNWDESIIGFIENLEQDSFTIKEVDEFGYNIGKTIIKFSDIVSVDIDDRYQKRLQYLCDNKDKLNSYSSNKYTIWKTGKELTPFFVSLINKKEITTFYFEEENYVIGILIKFDEDYIHLKNIGIEGDEDGYSYYPIEGLIGIRYHSLTEGKIKILFENNKKFY